MSNKKDVPVTDLEAHESEDVKGGGMAINQRNLTMNVTSFGSPVARVRMNPISANPNHNSQNQLDQVASTVMCPW